MTVGSYSLHVVFVHVPPKCPKIVAIFLLPPLNQKGSQFCCLIFKNLSHWTLDRKYKKNFKPATENLPVLMQFFSTVLSNQTGEKHGKKLQMQNGEGWEVLSSWTNSVVLNCFSNKTNYLQRKRTNYEYPSHVVRLMWRQIEWEEEQRRVNTNKRDMHFQSLLIALRKI